MNAIIKWKFRDTTRMGKESMGNYVAYIKGQVIDRQLLINDFKEFKSDLNDTNEKTDIGLFHNHDVSEEDLELKLLQHNGNVWIPIISFKEETARELELLSEKDYELLSHDIIDIVSEELKMPLSNLNYLVGFHMKPEGKQKQAGLQPHLHFLIWEDEPFRKRGLIDDDEFNNIKIKIDKCIEKKIKIKQIASEKFKDHCDESLFKERNLELLSSELFEGLDEIDIEDAIEYLKDAEENHIWLRDIIEPEEEIAILEGQIKKRMPRGLIMEDQRVYKREHKKKIKQLEFFKKERPEFIKRLNTLIGEFFSVKTLREKLEKVLVELKNKMKEFVADAVDIISQCQMKIVNNIVRDKVTFKEEISANNITKCDFNDLIEIIDNIRIYDKSESRKIQNAIMMLSMLSINRFGDAIVRDKKALEHRSEIIKKALDNNISLRDVGIGYIKKSLQAIVEKPEELESLQSLITIDEANKALKMLRIKKAALPEQSESSLYRAFYEKEFVNLSDEELFAADGTNEIITIEQYDYDDTEQSGKQVIKHKTHNKQEKNIEEYKRTNLQGAEEIDAKAIKVDNEQLKITDDKYVVNSQNEVVGETWTNEAMWNNDYYLDDSLELVRKRR